MGSGGALRGSLARRPRHPRIIHETEPLSDLVQRQEKFGTVPQSVSFTDCLVMAVADEYGTRDIFGLDKQFTDAGYNRLTPSQEWKNGA